MYIIDHIEKARFWILIELNMQSVNMQWMFLLKADESHLELIAKRVDIQT